MAVLEAVLTIELRNAVNDLESIIQAQPSLTEQLSNIIIVNRLEGYASLIIFLLCILSLVMVFVQNGRSFLYLSLTLFILQSLSLAITIYSLFLPSWTIVWWRVIVTIVLFLLSGLFLALRAANGVVVKKAFGLLLCVSHFAFLIAVWFISELPLAGNNVISWFSFLADCVLWALGFFYILSIKESD